MRVTCLPGVIHSSLRSIKQKKSHLTGETWHLIQIASICAKYKHLKIN